MIRRWILRWLTPDPPVVNVVIRANEFNSASSVAEIANEVRKQLIRSQRRSGGSSFQ